MKKSRFGNVMRDLPTIGVYVLDIPENKDYTFIYEINKSVGIKDLEGKDKRIFKSTFSPNTNYLTEKWDYIVDKYNSDKEFKIPYRIKIQSGIKYLNLIFKNEFFKGIHDRNVELEAKKAKEAESATTQKEEKK